MILRAVADGGVRSDSSVPSARPGCPQGGVGECRANKDTPRHPGCPQGGVGECRANKDTPCHARVPDEPEAIDELKIIN